MSSNFSLERPDSSTLGSISYRSTTGKLLTEPTADFVNPHFIASPFTMASLIRRTVCSSARQMLMRTSAKTSSSICNTQMLQLESLKRTFFTGSRLLAVNVTQPAPNFKGQAVVDGQFKEIQLSDFKGKYLVLFFYPLDFTFVCPTEIIAFSDSIDKFKQLNTEVVGVSTDSHFSHLAWINTPRKQGGLGGLKYPLLADFCKSISRDYGVLLEEPGIALRGLFIIDPKGVVRQMTVNDLPVGRSVEETLRLIQAFQFVEKHGEVCPANWTPNSATIKPDPQGSKDYFEKVN